MPPDNSRTSGRNSSARSGSRRAGSRQAPQGIGSPPCRHAPERRDNKGSPEGIPRHSGRHGRDNRRARHAANRGSDGFRNNARLSRSGSPDRHPHNSCQGQPNRPKHTLPACCAARFFRGRSVRSTGERCRGCRTTDRPLRRQPPRHDDSPRGRSRPEAGRSISGQNDA